MTVEVRIATLAAALCAAVGCSSGRTSQDPAETKEIQGAPDAAPSKEATARGFVELLAKGRFADAAGRFDAKMKAALPAAELERVWRSLVDQVGGFQSIAAARVAAAGEYATAYVTCKFEKASLDAKIAFDREGQIAGLFFVPARDAAATSESEPPPYARRDAFEEHPLEIGKGDWAVPGTLSLPVGSGRFPAVVLIHGSGPQDRDETIGPNKPFRDLAWGLASRGIAVVRYDKRSHVHGARMAGIHDLTVQEEVVDDAIAAAAVARANPAIDPKRVFLVGHSLGGVVAPRILAGDAAIAGAVILAGTPRPLHRLIAEQVKRLVEMDGTVSDVEAGRLREVETAAAAVDAPSFSPASPPALGLPASYWIDLRKRDAMTAARSITRPLLFLQGGRDYQVTAIDFDAWREGLRGRPNCSFHVYPDLNHLFMPGTEPSTPAEYDRPSHVAVQVVDDIAAWIGRPTP